MINFFKKLFTRVSGNVPLPITFFTNGFIEDKGYMGEDYSFEELDESQKKILIFFFNCLTFRLDIITQATLKSKVDNDLLAKKDENFILTFMLKVYYEICMFDFATLKRELTKIKKIDENIIGAIRDTIYWTFDSHKLHKQYYKSYEEMEADKSNFYNEFINEYDYNKDPDMDTADRFYYKILEKPCSPFLLSMDFYGNMNKQLLIEKAKFAGVLINGQRKLILETINYLTLVKNTVA